MYLLLLLMLINCLGEASESNAKKRKNREPIKIVISDEPTSLMSESQRKFYNSIEQIRQKRQRREIELAEELKNCSNNNNIHVKNS